MRRDTWARVRPMLAGDGDGGGAGAGSAETPGAVVPAAAANDGTSDRSAAGTSAPAPDPSKLRELVLAANPGVIAEMIAGATLDELLASVAPAKAAYDRVVASVQQGKPAAPAIPAGGGASARQFVVNIEELSPAAKIAEGLRQRKARS